MIDVAAPDEECRSRRDDDQMLEICKVGSEFCIDEMERSRLVLLCRTVDDGVGSGFGSGSGSDSRSRVYTAWFRNGERISDDNRHFSVEARGTELHFVQRRIPGKYTCFVHNSAGQHNNANTTIKSKLSLSS